MPASSGIDVLARLSWRYAVKRFDPKLPISESDWQTLERALVLSPSSYGLQPYRFLVIDDPALRARLREASFGQAQVTDASRLVVFAIRRDMDVAYVDRYLARIAEVRGAPVESLGGLRAAIIGDLIDGPRHAWLDHWSARQAYLALGNLLTCAAMLGIDACPMEGFDPARYDEILALPQSGFAAAVQCALGYRSTEDKLARQAKVRMPASELIEHR